jgi:uncharacterized tellurite resistance protein B-like protein
MTNWFEQLKTVFAATASEADDDGFALPRAAAVLLLEVSATDPGGEALEARVIETALIEHFGLGRSEAEAVLSEAHRLQQDSNSMHEFSHRLRTRLAPEARAELVEWLWKVAFADGRLDRHEEHLIRRLADLLGTPHREFIRRKHRAGPGG